MIKKEYMRIGIDARMYGPKQGGLGRYIQQLILNLEKIDSVNEYVIFLRKENWDEFTPTAPNFTKKLADIHWYGWREQLLLPKILNTAKVDLMHFPHWNVPFFYRQPFVATIHDLLLLHYPTRAASTLGPISYFFKNIAFKFILNHTAKSAKQIITPCEFVKNDIVKTLKINPEKIAVTLLAPTLSVGHGTLSVPPDNLPTQPYVLYVGVAFPHKNLPGLIRAWKIFTEKYDNSYRLVLVGKENYFYRQLQNHPLVKELKNKPIFTGFVPDEQLAHFYQNASLYIFPSLYEGFGVPPLEAMQYNIPVASSNRTCLPEILKDAVVYFDPENYEAIAETIKHALTDENLRKNLIIKGQNLLKNYSWDATTKQTLKIYQNWG
ncbi:MAG: hypothetical protein A3J93_04750 [Candidatus Magasanikbacteria bacterium RIFOXYC2_FULL_42_28]|uniref:Glycosyl transferase family 1 domain-containing protein n=1 Tax=Candidatus Magasanikbacteria bacterium RIFOXYC2_FULL_42_28 TaxID=1798704 RepID=A0A1F6NXG0_9BACT|nr:MAG: hypothetical protein A3J93_04750 [Candidatus Magasanikbacteria bacterium RIFOXYC2_FULL_42_28]